MIASAVSAFGTGTEITNVRAVPEKNEVRIEIELTTQVTPTIKVVGNPCRFIIDFPNVSFKEPPRPMRVNKNGVNEVRVSENHGNPLSTRLIVGIDSVRPFGTRNLGKQVCTEHSSASIDSGSNRRPSKFAECGRNE
jgi:hypothetical protein